MKQLFERQPSKFFHWGMFMKNHKCGTTHPPNSFPAMALMFIHSSTTTLKQSQRQEQVPHCNHKFR